MKKPHYGWAVCLGGLLLITCCMGATTNAFTVYLPYIESFGGYTGAQGSAIMTVRCLFSLLAMFWVNHYYKKIGLRWGIAIGCAVNVAGFAVYAFAQSLWGYYIGAALTGIAYGVCGMIPVSLLMNNWFLSRRTTALGLCAAGTGIANICLPPVITYLVEKLGLRYTFAVETVFIFVCGILIVWLVRDTPAQKGMQPYGSADEQKQTLEVKQTGCLPEYMQLVVCFAVLLLGCVASAGTSHYTVLFATNGFSPTTIALGLSLMGLTLTVGKTIYGAVVDKLGGYYSTMLSFGVILLCNIACFITSVSMPWTFWLVMLFTGFGYPPATVGVSVWAADFSKKENYAITLKWYQVAYAIGGLAFSVVPGYVYDKIGSYNIVYFVCAVFVVVFAAIIALAYRITKKQRNLLAE